MHGFTELWNFSLCVQLSISQVSTANERDTKLNQKREIPYLQATIYHVIFNEKKWILFTLLLILGAKWSE